MNSSPKLSVIVPVYNVEAFIRECLNSIKNQTFTDFEVLMIDDGSPDGSGAICDEYAAKDSRFKVFHKKNGGLSSARNFGLDYVKGEWVVFLDSDDYLLSDKVYEEIFNNDLNAIDFVRFGYRLDKGNAEYEIKLPLESISENESIVLNKKESIEHFDIFNSTCWLLVRNSIIKGLKFEFIKPHEDRLWTRTLLSRINNSLIINKEFYFYRKNINSITKSYIPSYAHDTVYYLKKNKEIFDQQNIEYNEEKFKKYCLDMFWFSLSNSLLCPNKKIALKEVKETFDGLRINEIMSWQNAFNGNSFFLPKLLLKIRAFRLLMAYRCMADSWHKKHPKPQNA